MPVPRQTPRTVEVLKIFRLTSLVTQGTPVGLCPDMRVALSTAGAIRAPFIFVMGALGAAMVAMTALHIVQADLDPIQEPVSFYVHGEMGWLLSLALGLFGASAIGLALSVGESLSTRSRRSLVFFGLTMLLSAVVPSDRWFPWEINPSFHGSIHGVAAILGPVVLLHPMIETARRRQTQPSPTIGWLVLAYCAALIGSAMSLVIGLILDRAPPHIGLAERVLALAAVAWVATAASQQRPLGLNA